jgi:phosphoglycolate phosphatase
MLFDKDGTLFDFAATWGAWTRRLVLELAEGAEPMARRLAGAIGYGFDDGTFDPSSPVIAHTPSEIAEALLPHLPGAAPMSLVARMNALSAEAAPVPAVPLRPLLSGLRDRGMRIGLVTNDSEGPARVHLSLAGIADLFDFIAGCDSGFGAKPQAGPLLAFARQTGLTPAAIAMIGDSRHDLIAGRAAGMRTIGVLTGLSAASDLAPLAEAVLPDIGHLPGWLDASLAVPAD